MQVAPTIPVVHLMHDAPPFRPDLAAYLLAACAHWIPRDAVVVAVVDPGVGGARDALVVETSHCRLVGPDNGLLSQVPGIERASRINWRPDRLSDSFHGRDLFAPVAAGLAVGDTPRCAPLQPGDMLGSDWESDPAVVVYIDGFGNAMTAVRAEKLNTNNVLVVGGQRLRYARTFSAAAPGELFWYGNSQGLVEIAGNGVSAAERLPLALGDRFLLDWK
jgi:S-adenosylmethionine hydrolase